MKHFWDEWSFFRKSDDGPPADEPPVPQESVVEEEKREEHEEEEKVKPMRKLGKKAAQNDKRTLRFSKYSVTRLHVPDEVSWIMNINEWPMFLNDVVNDSVVAAAGHMLQQWSFYANPPGVKPTDAEILKAYQAISGYAPPDSNTDIGTDMLSTLNYWQKTGIAGRKIVAFVKLADPIEIKTAIWLFGNAFVGLKLPKSAIEQSDCGQPWTVADGGIYTPQGAPGGWGGHCVPCMAASPHSVTGITWGARQKISWNFLHDYTDEAYAVLSEEWIQKSGKTLAGFDLATLKADLKLL